MVGGGHDTNSEAGGRGIRRIVHRVVLVSSCALFVIFLAIAIVGWTVVGEFEPTLMGYSLYVGLNPSRNPLLGKEPTGLPPPGSPTPLPCGVYIERECFSVMVMWADSAPTQNYIRHFGVRWFYCQVWGIAGTGRDFVISIWLWLPPILFAIYPAIFFVRRVRRRRRMQQLNVYCDACGYNLSGNVSGVCPECGVAIPEAALARIGIEERAT